MGTAADPFSETITDFLNNMTVQAGLLWYIGRNNVLAVGTPPSTVNRLLINTVPASPTLIGNINRVYAKYVSSDDGQGNQNYSWAMASNQPDINLHQPNEQPVDLTPAGVMSSETATGWAQLVLQQFQAAAFGNSFQVRYGQLLTTGGQAVDPATEQAGTVCRLLSTDSGYGGEITPGPVQFLTGNYAYDDDSQTGTVTPWQSYKTDYASLLTAAVPGLRQ